MLAQEKIPDGQKEEMSQVWFLAPWLTHSFLGISMHWRYTMNDLSDFPFTEM